MAVVGQGCASLSIDSRQPKGETIVGCAWMDPSTRRSRLLATDALSYCHTASSFSILSNCRATHLVHPKVLLNLRWLISCYHGFVGVLKRAARCLWMLSCWFLSLERPTPTFAKKITSATFPLSTMALFSACRPHSGRPSIGRDDFATHSPHFC